MLKSKNTTNLLLLLDTLSTLLSQHLFALNKTKHIAWQVSTFLLHENSDRVVAISCNGTLSVYKQVVVV